MTIGFVAIGRNEGDKLSLCLRSLDPVAQPMVYVDSGSSDGSVELARSLGADVVELDTSSPFSAARARNEGLRRLVQWCPDTLYVQFVDGDCELVHGWPRIACLALDTNPRLAVVCGRRRERFAALSKYNTLCDIEWDTPVGVAEACGGDAMMRVAALHEVGGFDASLVAGEEPELCVRLRGSGWTITRLDKEMTIHDAVVTSFGQWWRRTVRAGFSYAEGAWRHGLTPEHHKVRPLCSAMAWGALLPLLVVTSVLLDHGAGLFAGLLYPLQWWRINRHQLRLGRTPQNARLYASFTLLGKPAEVQGVVQSAWSHLRSRGTGPIEYKNGPSSRPSAP